ncbi:MAG TPA: hypothetical protein VEQ60_05665 [Longimicrobium sp.]|nr:hypothetical protein [Longimicrobium sp.]
MITRFRTLLCAGAALLAAGTLNAQGRCPNGEADQEGINVGVVVLAHPTRLAATVDSVLNAQGYTVEGSPAGLGRWRVEPRFTWLDKVMEEGWHGSEHPGVQVTIATEAHGDSTELSAGARALCKVPPVEGMPGEVGQMVELLSATMLAGSVMEALDSLEAHGTDLTAPVQRAQSEQAVVTAPPQVAGFSMAGRHDYEDPRLGTTVRYSRGELIVDIYVYPGVQVDAQCDAACAVNSEVDGFIGDFPELIRAGHYEKLSVSSDEPLQPSPGAPWRYGRHLAMNVRREGRDMESHFWLYSMPGFFLKVRASYPASPAARREVQAFVDELPGKLLTRQP